MSHQRNRLPPMRRAITGVGTIALLALILITMGSKMSTTPPEKYFDGQALEAAKAINAGDATRLRSAAESLDLDAPARQNMTLLWYAITRKRADMVKALVELGSHPDEQIAEGIGSALTGALMTPDTTILAAMLDGGLSPDHQPEGRGPLLHRTVLDGSPEHVKLLIARGADVNIRSAYVEDTALYEAVTSGQPELAIYLVEHGADVTATTSNGVTIAWSVERTLARLQPGVTPPAIRDVSVDSKGRPVVTTFHPASDGDSAQGQTVRMQFEQLQALMVEGGAIFPAEPPAKVRERLKSPS